MKETLDDTLPLPSEFRRSQAVDSDGGAAPATVGRYTLLGELGTGGMGRVVEAWDPELRRRVAVKLVRSPAGASGSRLARFVAEAQITSQLQHPNIVPVHDMGVSDDGLLYFVMKKVQGQSLHELLARLRGGDEEARRRWTRPRLLRVFTQVGQAVAYAHQRGVLHRDLKPANIMLGPFGEVLLMDWGLAGRIRHPLVETPDEPVLSTYRGQTRAGSTLGTPGYMAPEQAEGVRTLVDERSDVWSLGSILFEVLTWRRAFDTEQDVLHLGAGRREVPDPRAAAPRLGVPDDIAEVCMRALAPRRSDRFLTASALVEAVEGHLEGSRRREEADRRLSLARSLWDRHELLDREYRHVRDQQRQLEAVTEPWAPLDDRYKSELLSVRHRGQELLNELASTFGGAVSAAEHALAAEPGHPGARDLLATAWWRRFEEAERKQDPGEAAFCRARTAQYDVGRYAAELSAEGRLTLRTEPRGATVRCRRVDRRGLLWTAGEDQLLGTTPLEAVALPKGSYVLQIQAPGRVEVTYPAFITRGGDWDCGDEPVRLPRAVPEGFVFVPEGPFVAGGDPRAGRALPAGRPWVPSFAIARHPVTVGEYLEFLNSVHLRNPADAARRCPRRGPDVDAPSLLDPPDAQGGYRLPEADAEGHAWEAAWPICSVSWNDAVAYAIWRSERDRLPLGLPTELQWEKAARGVDGRLFPWGSEFDPTLCKMSKSRQGPPMPEPVGTYPHDRSVYGAMDFSGCIREWCDDAGFEDNPELRPVRGGAWSASERVCRTTNRYGFLPRSVHTYLGFRLALKLVA